MLDFLDYAQAKRAADKAIAHYLRLLAGRGLTEADKRFAQLRLIRAMGERVRAEREMERGD